VLIADGGPFRRGATVQAACDLTDIAPTLLHLLGMPATGMEGRILAEAWDATTDAPPTPEWRMLPNGFRLEMARQGRRRYPTGLTRAA
jgi:arylsulfatase A-like enzyme